MKVFRNGVLIWDELTDPYGMTELMAGWYPESDPSEFSLDLAEVKAFKVPEIRRAADDYWDRTDGDFEGLSVLRSMALSLPLSPEDRAVDERMSAVESRRDGLVEQVKAAADWRARLDVKWADPA